MATPIKKLKELSDTGVENLFYPLTHPKAVQWSNGETLETELIMIKNALWPITVTLTASKIDGVDKVSNLIYDEDEKKSGYLYIDFKQNGIDCRDKIEEISLDISPNDGSFIILGDYDSTTKSIPFEFSDSENIGYSSHTITLTAKITGQDNNFISDTCIIKEIASSYITFTKQLSPSVDILKNTESRFKKIIRNTSISGTFNFNQVPVGYCFWIITPSSKEFNDPKSVSSSGGPVIMKKYSEIIEINGVNYEFFSNASGPMQAQVDWEITIR